jgi:serine/threonine protein kinase
MPTHSMRLPTGSFLGVYEILAPLGEGGMGEVYRARDPRLHREVAIKILRDAAANPERQRRFAQEAIAASALNHPNILVVYDVGVEAGVPYIVSEFIDGAPLREEMQRGRIPIRRLVEVAACIADGLAAAHSAGIVHRDLKPENVMVGRDGQIKIVDFGLAKARAEDAEEILRATGPTQTASGLVMGTVPYMSPEQAAGGAVDFRSDQFSFGLMLYEMGTADHPFLRATPVQTLSAVIADEPRRAAELNPLLPAPLLWVIERCLAKDSRGRYAHTADLAADLHHLRERLPDIAREFSAVSISRTAPGACPTGDGAVAVVIAFAAGPLSPLHRTSRHRTSTSPCRRMRDIRVNPPGRLMEKPSSTSPTWTVYCRCSLEVWVRRSERRSHGRDSTATIRSGPTTARGCSFIRWLAARTRCGASVPREERPMS